MARSSSSPLRWLLVLAVALVAVWYWIAPHRAYDRLLRAVAFGSQPELEATVDFAAVREHLHTDLSAAMTRRSGRGLGQAMVSAVLDQAVDAVLTPAGLSNIVTGFGTRAADGSLADTVEARTDVSFHYRSLSRVDVHIRPAGEPDDRSGILTFTRDGVRWRLTRIWSERLLNAGGPR